MLGWMDGCWFGTVGEQASNQRKWADWREQAHSSGRERRIALGRENKVRGRLSFLCIAPYLEADEMVF